MTMTMTTTRMMTTMTMNDYQDESSKLLVGKNKSIAFDDQILHHSSCGTEVCRYESSSCWSFVCRRDSAVRPSGVTGDRGKIWVYYHL
jgi:hypothetical protein